MLGPIFPVELVAIARRRRYFLVRVAYAALILFVLWTSYASMRVFHTSERLSIQQAATLANGFFVSFSWLQMLAVMAMAPAVAAGTIATERERRTIEYLFVTDLANREIILGKAFARLFVMAKFILVGLPILFLFRLMGGIPANALVASFVAAGSTAIMLTALGICVSAWSPRARDATARIYLLLFAGFVIPMLLLTFHQFQMINQRWWDLCCYPVVAFFEAINPLRTLWLSTGNFHAVGFGLSMREVAVSAASQIGVAIAALVLATGSVRRVHLRQSTKAAKTFCPRLPWKLPSFRPSLGRFPMFWKEVASPSSASRLGLLGGLLSLVMVVGVIILTIYAFTTSTVSMRGNDYNEYLVGLCAFAGSAKLLILATRAAGLITQEKERETWLALLATPLTAHEIILGKLAGNLYSLRWVVTILLFAWALALILSTEYLLPAVLFFVGFTVLATYSSLLGLLFSLQSPTSLRAIGSTLAVLIFFGGGYLLLCCACMFGGPGRSGSEIMAAPFIPFLLGFPPLLPEYREPVDALPFAFGVGLVGYTMVAIGIYGYMVNEFERISGRCGNAPAPDQPHSAPDGPLG